MAYVSFKPSYPTRCSASGVWTLLENFRPPEPLTSLVTSLALCPNSMILDPPMCMYNSSAFHRAKHVCA